MRNKKLDQKTCDDIIIAGMMTFLGLIFLFARDWVMAGVFLTLGIVGACSGVYHYFRYKEYLKLKVSMEKMGFSEQIRFLLRNKDSFKIWAAHVSEEEIRTLKTTYQHTAGDGSIADLARLLIKYFATE